MNDNNLENKNCALYFGNMNELKTCCTALYVNMCGSLNGFNLTLIFEQQQRGKIPSFVNSQCERGMNRKQL